MIQKFYITSDVIVVNQVIIYNKNNQNIPANSITFDPLTEYASDQIKDGFQLSYQQVMDLLANGLANTQKPTVENNKELPLHTPKKISISNN